MGIGNAWAQMATICTQYLTPEFGAAMSLVSGFPICNYLDELTSSDQAKGANELEDSAFDKAEPPQSKAST